ncbi:hypothetical protein MO867_19615 [Microbulbifer sp. OS29]|uniref:Uncharacterized protein n=1 Tax=Microbulbifer okhotskensis TaxID=2926617 RepID=A0A9X2EW33_9GAMM|nr:hypothetical protein [Microbulbifer okhotskensis]MCO1336543.1 hypothetical protein [Microbulbifer okhotskensis]
MGRDEEIEKLIGTAKAAYMSNTKWKKLFEAAETFGEPLGAVKWKFLWCDIAMEHPLDVLGLLESARFIDSLPAPYAELKEIHWIYIPEFHSNPQSDKKRSLPDIHNNLALFSEHLAGFGSFPVFFDRGGIKIKGYDF